MKILITGALGYIGTQLLYNLRNTECEIIAFDNSEDAMHARLGYLLQTNKNLKFMKYDLHDNLKVFKDCDLVIHLAAEVGYITCDENPELAQKTNVEGTKKIADLNIPTIFLSTGSVYGKLEQDCVETLPLNPATLYAETKAIGEEIISEIDNFTILRPATAYGLSFKVRHDLLIHTLCSDAIKYGHIDLYQPNAKRTFFHVNDLANTIEYIIDNFSEFNKEIFNVGSDLLNIRKVEIVEEIKKHVELTYKIVKDEDKDMRDYYVDYSKLNKFFKANNPLKIDEIVNFYGSFH